MLPRFGRLRYALIALLLVVVACGGGDTGAGSDDDGDFDPSGSDDTFSFETPTTVGDLAGVSDECESLTNLSIAMTAMFTGSPEQVDGLLAGVRSVPGEIADEVDILTDAIRGLTAAWSEIGENPLTNPAGLTELSDSELAEIEALVDQFDNDATNDAFETIGEYVARECFG